MFWLNSHPWQILENIKLSTLNTSMSECCCSNDAIIKLRNAQSEIIFVRVVPARLDIIWDYI